MKTIPQIDRRAESRQESYAKVRFSVNGGPEHTSNTLNFTRKSLAIRSSVAVHVGDKVRAVIGDLPAFEGTVIRIWDEGFAILLTDEARSLVELCQGAEQLGDHGEMTGCARIVPVDAPDACWFGVCRRPGREDRPSLLVVTAHPFAAERIQSVWVSLGDMRSVARVLGTRHIDGQTMILLRIQEWQLQCARELGLTVTVLSPEMEEWCAHAAPDAIDELFFAEEMHRSSAA